MQISIANVIQVARRIGAAAAEVITTNLKMWLGFQTSETLGREEVVNGDFSDGTTGWLPNDWTISNNVAASGNTSSLLQQTNVFINSTGVYKSTFKARSVNGTNETLRFYDGLNEYETFTITSSDFQDFTLTRQRAGDDSTLYIFNNLDAEIEITNISVKELTQITPDKSGNNNVGELFTGKALEFDGSTSYVSANSFAGTLSTGDAFTFAIWFNCEKTLPARFFGNILISSGGPAQSNNIFKIGVNPRDTTDTKADGTVINIGGIYFDDSSGYNNVVPLSGGVNYNDGQWHRLVVARRQGSGDKDLSFYVDGSLIGAADCNPLWDNMTVFDFGQEWDGAGESDFFEGKMSNIQVYDYAWTSDDIAYDYANPQNLVTDRGGTIALSNLKGYWAMSEGAGSLVYDSSGEGNNGTINGATYEPAQPRIPQLGMMNWSKGSNLFPYSEDFTQWNVSSGGTITPNFALAPNGTQTATKYNIDGNFRVFLYTLNLSTSKEYTFSFYAKNISSTVAAYRVYDATNAANILVTSYLSELSTTDWTRIDVTFNTTSTGTRYNLYLMSGQGTGDILFWGAQLEESSSASAYRLTDGGATSNSTVIANPTIPTQDIFGNAVRDRLNSFNLGKFGGARPDAFTLSGNQATIQLWFKNVNSNDSLYLADLRSVTDRIVLGFESSQLSVYHGITGSWQNFGVITDGDWNFATFTFDGTTLKCFVGTSQLGVTKTISAINLNTTTQFGVGMNYFFSTRTQDYNGHISDFLIYDRVLTSDEIENNYNAGLATHS